MKLIQKIAAGILLTIGLPITLLTTIMLLNPSTSDNDKKDFLVAWVVLGLPPTVGGGLLLWNLVRQNQLEKEAREKEFRDRLNSIFFQLIEEKQGQITVLRFAKEAQISGTAARQFLDERAKEFDAHYDVAEEGNVIYRFPNL